MAREFKLKDLSSLAIQPGDMREVEVEGLDAKVLLVNAAGKIHATGPRCTHYGAPLAKGVLSADGRLTCPWHGACFNTSTGDVEDAPALDALNVFAVVERDGAVYVSGEESSIKAGSRKPNIQCKANTSAAAATDSADRVVVVGGGSGAIATVEALREKGFAGPITIVSKEDYPPIDRTKLSKALIADPAKVQWRDPDWFKAAAIDLVHDEVTDLDVAAKTLSTKNGQTLPYGKLVLATGGEPRNLPLQGFSVLGNIFKLRTIDDTKAINAAIGAKNKKIVVIGSSFIGMEVANATAAGNHVTVVGMDPVPLQAVLGDTVGAQIQKMLESKGVRFHMNASADRAEPKPADQANVGAVFLQDGTRLDADLVILGVGVAPATGFLRSSSLALEKDGSLRTDDHFAVAGQTDIYAVGDIATYPYYGPGSDSPAGRPVRIEHWNVAQNAGRAAARHIADPSAAPARFTPVFWSALGAQMRYCGNTAGGWDDVVIQGSLADGSWAAFYTRQDTVLAVATMGRDPVMAKTAELMRLGTMPGKKALQDGLDVRTLALAS